MYRDRANSSSRLSILWRICTRETNNFLPTRHFRAITKGEREKPFLPCLDLVVLGHGACEFVIKLLQGRHIRQGGVQKVATQRLVANVIDVVVTGKDTSAEVINPLHGGDTETLDAPQEILEGYQIPETEESRVSRIARILAFFSPEIWSPDYCLSSFLPIRRLP